MGPMPGSPVPPSLGFVAGQPRPVRSREFIYGLPGNSRAQQDEADRGTLHAVTSVQILEAVEASQAVDGMQRPVTFENPTIRRQGQRTTCQRL